jgi:MFS family permease
MTTIATDEKVSAAPDRKPLYAMFAANGISQVGNMMAAIAIPWFVLQTTGSAAQMGLSAFATTLPIFFSGMIGGVIVDRVGAKRMSIIADIFSMVTVALIPILYSMNALTTPILLILIFAGTILDTPGTTARAALLPDLIKRAGVKPEKANATYGSIWRFSILFGPPLAGVLIGLFGSEHTANVLWIDAATFAVSALLMAWFAPSQAPKTISNANPVSEMLEGLRFYGRERLLLALLILFAVVDLFANAVMLVVLPLYASRQYGSPEAYGLLLGLFGGGTLAGTVWYGARGHGWPRRFIVILPIVGFGLPLWILAALPSLPITLLFMFLMGLSIGPVGPLIMTLYQERIPPELRGRVFGARAAIDTVSIPFAALVTGVILERVDLQTTLVGFAVAFLVIIAAALWLPILRTMEVKPLMSTPNGHVPVGEEI